MPAFAMPSLLRLEDGSYLNAFHVVTIFDAGESISLTLAYPDANGNRTVVFRDPKSLEKIRKAWLPPSSPQAETPAE